MDGYILGFIAVSVLMLLVTIGALIFISFDGEDSGQNTRIRYTDIRQVNTNQIETVNVSGEVEIWQRSA